MTNDFQDVPINSSVKRVLIHTSPFHNVSIINNYSLAANLESIYAHKIPTTKAVIIFFLSTINCCSESDSFPELQLEPG